MLRAVPKSNVIGSSTVALGRIGNPLVTHLGAVSDSSAPQLGGLVLVGFKQPPAAPAEASVEGSILGQGVNVRYRTGVSPTAHAVWLLDANEDPLMGAKFADAIAKVRALGGVEYVQAVDVRSTPEQLAAIDKGVRGEAPKWLWAVGGVMLAGVVLTFVARRRRK